jgi:hypothetical protein
MFRVFVKNVSDFLLFLFYCSCYWILPCQSLSHFIFDESIIIFFAPISYNNIIQKPNMSTVN